MGQRAFDGQTIATVLMNHGFVPVDRTGNHLKRRYEHPVTEEVRVVSVPMKDRDEIPRVTLHSIAEQSGANDFEAWCTWVSEQS